MSKSIAFLFNASDVSAFLAKTEKGENITVFASGLDTYDALDKEKIPYKEIKTYPPLSVTMQHYDKAHRISLQFDPTIYASARNFFLEVFRSSYLASIIIKKHRPSVIYVSDIINESLYRKYHAEAFDLLPQAIIAYTKLHEMRLVVLENNRQAGSLIQSFLWQLTSDALRLYESRLRQFEITPPHSQKLIISASDYHLTNLKNFINQAAKKWHVIVLGKANPQIRKSLHHHVAFANIYQFISLPMYLFLVWKQILALIIPRFISIPISAQMLLSPLELKICRRCHSTFSYWRSILIPQGKLNKLAFKNVIRSISPTTVIASNGIDNYNRTLLSASQEAHVKDAVIIHHQITDGIDIIEERSGIESILFIP
ncbi:MAG: hypothetical protein UV05_C0034G0001, partial [candidate division CPR1 bacterium GW2011_GWA2_42_17]